MASRSPRPRIVAHLINELHTFFKVVDAVAFAHAHLVVHRDLKQDNILVAEAGEPVLLDFGIATLLDDESHETDEGHSSDRMLTPSYASPCNARAALGKTATMSTHSARCCLRFLATAGQPATRQ